MGGTQSRTPPARRPTTASSSAGLFAARLGPPPLDPRSLKLHEQLPRELRQLIVSYAFEPHLTTVLGGAANRASEGNATGGEVTNGGHTAFVASIPRPSALCWLPPCFLPACAPPPPSWLAATTAARAAAGGDSSNSGTDDSIANSGAWLVLSMAERSTGTRTGLYACVDAVLRPLPTLRRALDDALHNARLVASCPGTRSSSAADDGSSSSSSSSTTTTNGGSGGSGGSGSVFIATDGAIYRWSCTPGGTAGAAAAAAGSWTDKVALVAGNRDMRLHRDGHALTHACFALIRALCVNDAGTLLYVVDAPGRIRCVDLATQHVFTLCGSVQPPPRLSTPVVVVVRGTVGGGTAAGARTDEADGTFASATFHNPTGICFDPFCVPHQSALLVRTSRAIRRIDLVARRVTTVYCAPRGAEQFDGLVCTPAGWAVGLRGFGVVGIPLRRALQQAAQLGSGLAADADADADADAFGDAKAAAAAADGGGGSSATKDQKAAAAAASSSHSSPSEAAAANASSASAAKEEDEVVVLAGHPFETGWLDGALQVARFGRPVGLALAPPYVPTITLTSDDENGGAAAAASSSSRQQHAAPVDAAVMVADSWAYAVRRIVLHPDMTAPPPLPPRGSAD